MRAQSTRERLTDASAVRVPAQAPTWIVPTVKVVLLITDALAATFSFMAAFYLREGTAVLVKTAGGFTWSGRFSPYGGLLLLIICIRILTLRYCDLYRLRGEFSVVDDGLRIFKAVSIGSLLIVAAAFLYRGGFAFRAFSYARGIFVLDFFLALASIGAIRVLMRAAQIFVRQRKINLIPTLVVGRGPEAVLCIREMRERPSLGYRVIGVVDSGVVEPHEAGSYEGVPVIGNLKALPEAIRDSGANEVIIADPQVNGDALFDVMIRCGRRRGIEFRIAPSLFNFLPRIQRVQFFTHRNAWAWMAGFFFFINFALCGRAPILNYTKNTKENLLPGVPTQIWATLKDPLTNYPLIPESHALDSG